MARFDRLRPPKANSTRIGMVERRSERSARAWRLVFVVGLIGLLFWTLVPYPPAHPYPTLEGKLGHCFAFGTLAFLGVLAFPRANVWRLTEALSLIAGAIELLQLLPAINRNSNVLDWLFETLAIALVVSLSPRSR